VNRQAEILFPIWNFSQSVNSHSITGCHHLATTQKSQLNRQPAESSKSASTAPKELQNLNSKRKNRASLSVFYPKSRGLIMNETQEELNPLRFPP